MLRNLFDFFGTPTPTETQIEPPRLMRIVIADTPIDYQLHRARRKTVSMQIERQGLIVRAPLRLAQKEIDRVLHDRSAWIAETLHEWKARTALIAADYRDGGSILFRGKRLRLHVAPALFESFEIGAHEIVMTSPRMIDPVAQKTAIDSWMRSVAQTEFAPQVIAMAQTLEASVRSVKLTDTKTMWGSCTSAGVIRLTFRLIQLPPALAHYVMAHEVAHLREMNHSKAFWNWVRVLDPHFQSHRRTLAQYTPLLEE